MRITKAIKAEQIRILGEVYHDATATSNSKGVVNSSAGFASW